MDGKCSTLQLTPSW